MASVIDICNLALAHIGDRATVASIDPPEGSPQAAHCAMFYPIARDTLLELAKPTFAMRRATLALLDETVDAWSYTYARPADALVILSVTAPGQADTSTTPEPFACEADADGALVIYTNVEQAQVRYLARVEDTTKFSALFTEALAWMLAAKLAGPVIKGDAGATMAARCEQTAMAILAKASASDANQGHLGLVPTPGWIGVR